MHTWDYQVTEADAATWADRTGGAAAKLPTPVRLDGQAIAAVGADT